jgi:feruloyl-CoA synthase
VIAAGDPCVQDVVVAGINRNEIGILIFPRADSCRALAQLPATASLREVLGAPAVQQFFQRLVNAAHASGTGSSTRVARALVLVDPPSIDQGEITDKGSINQRAVLAQRDALVEHLFAGGSDVLLPQFTK